MTSLKPNQNRAKNAILLLWLMLIIDLIALISHYFQYSLLSKINYGFSISSAEAYMNDLREQVIAVVYLAIFICTGIAFLKWFRRAYNNLHLLGLSLYHSEGWAVGSWFVPILSLFRPVQIMNEMYDETKTILIKNDIGEGGMLTKRFIPFWWAFWVIGNILGQILFQFSKNAKDVGELMSVTIMQMVFSFIGIITAGLALKVVKDYSKVEHHLTGIEGVPDYEENMSVHLNDDDLNINVS